MINVRTISRRFWLHKIVAKCNWIPKANITCLISKLCQHNKQQLANWRYTIKTKLKHRFRSSSKATHKLMDWCACPTVNDEKGYARHVNCVQSSKRGWKRVKKKSDLPKWKLSKRRGMRGRSGSWYKLETSVRWFLFTYLNIYFKLYRPNGPRSIFMANILVLYCASLAIRLRTRCIKSFSEKKLITCCSVISPWHWTLPARKMMFTLLPRTPLSEIIVLL